MIDYEHLRVIRQRRPPSFTPPVKRYALRWDCNVELTVTAYFAVQGATKEIVEASDFKRVINGAFSLANGPQSFDQGYFVDGAGLYNFVFVAYWLDPAAFERWDVDARWRDWWDDPARLTGSVGLWREVLSVPPERMETLYAYPDYKVGLARCEPSRFGFITRNGYFGAMRDRIPLTAIDTLPAAMSFPTPVERETSGARWYIHAPKNLTVIRSGQYWANCGDEQRTDYLVNMRPLLETGTQYLAQHPDESGCLAMRLARNVDPSGRERDESFNHAYFLSLAHLEEWSASHRTHLAIWKHAVAMMRKYGEARELRTWHEVYVLPGHGQRFEYVNCNLQTGLLPYFEGTRLA